MSPNTATTRTPGRKTNAELTNELNAAKAINDGLLCLIDAIHLCAVSVPRSAEHPMNPELERAREMLVTIGAFTNRKDPDVILMPTFLASFAAHIERQAAAPLTYLPYAADDGGWISGPCATTGDDAIVLVQPGRAENVPWPCCRHCVDGDGMQPCGEVHDEPCGTGSCGEVTDAELAEWRKGLQP